jgi:hypothetical protein
MLLLVALVLAIVPVVSAQDTLGASQEDYDLWTTANANLAAAQSFALTFTLNGSTTGMGNSNGTIALTGSGMVDTNPAAPQFQLDVTGTAETTEVTPVTLSVRGVNGNLYTNNNNEGWEVSTAASSSTSALGMPLDPTTLMENPMVGELLSGLSSVQPSEFLALTSADQSGLKELTVTVDIAKLVASPAAAPLFGGMMGMMGGGSQQMSAEQLQQMQGMMAAMLSTSQVSLVELVDPATRQVQQITFTANVPLEMVGPGAAVSLNLQANLSNFNQPITVEVPADAQTAGG